MSRPLALVLAAAGTNRDHDVAFALDLAGAESRIVLLADLIERPEVLDGGQMLVIAGGFSYADALGAGRMFALQLDHRIGDTLRQFVAAGKPVIGICNGFQVLTRTGLLPGALGHNASGHFQCEWVRLAAATSHCIWTAGIAAIDCPIAHGEGRYTHPNPAALAAAGQVALRYSSSNPNGSTEAIAGVCDESGVVLGLMPHPENHVIARQYPGFTSGSRGDLGLALFEQGVRYAKEH
ncbi:MAG: phosphoribosylformylglycinamidine synthase subunit PurQ / glutaminase [Ilumatobacteraceae bacterium]|nr:phosphoribosylformylglycinamidine synthase subunit PurQ / glutaminase [Ilumatobacteraceae bacterium]